METKRMNYNRTYDHRLGEIAVDLSLCGGNPYDPRLEKKYQYGSADGWVNYLMRRGLYGEKNKVVAVRGSPALSLADTPIVSADDKLALALAVFSQLFARQQTEIERLERELKTKRTNERLVEDERWKQQDISRQVSNLIMQAVSAES